MIIRNKNGQSGVLTQINGFDMVETLSENFLLSFNVLRSDRFFDLVQEWQTVEVAGHEFIIVKKKEIIPYKSVQAIHSFYRLVGTRQESIYGGTRTINEFLTFIFQGTGWTFEVDFGGSALIANFGYDNIVSLVNTVCAAFNCEYQLLPGKRVRFSRQIGGDFNHQYRYKVNTVEISSEVDINNVYTVIEVEGANGKMITYRSPNVAAFGEIKAAPIKDERFTETESMIEYAKQNLTDEPTLSLELDVIELGDRGIGEKVWLIHEVLGIEMQTRVVEKKYRLVGNSVKLHSLTLGNGKVKTVSDLLVEQIVDVSEYKKQVQSRFEQTDSEIVLAVEEIGGTITELNISLDGITQRIENNEGTMAEFYLSLDGINQKIENTNGDIAELNISLGGISQRVQNAEGSISSLNISIGSVETRVNQKITETNGRVSNAEAAINVQATQITNKVSYTDYNGRTISSLINQDAYSYSINASKINLTGAVIVNGDISGATNITIQNSIAIGNALYFGGFKSSFDYIEVAGGNMQFNSWGAFQFIGTSGVDVIAGTLRVGGQQVTVTRTPGLGFGYSSASKRLYVSINGVDQGSILLT